MAETAGPRGIRSWPEEGWPELLAPPVTEMTWEAQDLCARVSPPYLFSHSARCYAWACALAERWGIDCDLEMLYTASFLHDLGLTDTFEGRGYFSGSRGHELADEDPGPAGNG